jgi:hypothetical protein
MPRCSFPVLVVRVRHDDQLHRACTKANLVPERGHLDGWLAKLSATGKQVVGGSGKATAPLGVRGARWIPSLAGCRRETLSSKGPEGVNIHQVASESLPASS